MGRLRRWLLMLSPILITVLVLLSIPRSRLHIIAVVKGEPYCDEKPLSYWVHLLHDENALVRKQAAFSLGEAGAIAKPVVPELAGATTDPSEDVRITATLSLYKIGPAGSACADRRLKRSASTGTHELGAGSISARA
jgi:hypothetical protein